jgi:organic hydroperoxide reductase OsmC/OhrA
MTVVQVSSRISVKDNQEEIYNGFKGPGINPPQMYGMMNAECHMTTLKVQASRKVFSFCGHVEARDACNAHPGFSRWRSGL